VTHTAVRVEVDSAYRASRPALRAGRPQGDALQGGGGRQTRKGNGLGGTQVQGAQNTGMGGGQGRARDAATS